MPFTPAPARGVTAVLGPTNTGKTHLAIERMLGHESGLIGLPLRLLAREVYDRVVARVGAAQVALITGEEKIKPPQARYWICTVEAMPQTLDVAFVAIDEVQLAADPERGHVFTNRFLHARGTQETLLLGSDTMRSVISDTLPGANFVARPRLSQLSYAGQKKVSRLPRRTAIVAFSAADVYAIAELIRRQRGGAAVVMGALSPRTRNAQVELYQSEEVDFLVATDAIGMGLNLNVGHVAFAATRKFDGQRMRNLTHSEMAQIAGRAGRHMNDGTFGVTGDTEPFEQETVEALENHTFEPVKMLQWRNAKLDYSSVPALRASLNESPGHGRLARARTADDVITLEAALRDDDVSRLAVSPAAIKRLWEVCQVPDYRKISASTHAELVVTLYRHLLSPQEKLPEDWFAKHVAQADRTDGDIDTLATRLAHMRTWTFIANRADWLDNPEGWQQKTREIEDKLSDALHDQLTQRFVDRRTSTLMKSLRDSDELFAEISDDGAIHVEKHYVGRLMGLRYIADAEADGAIDAKASRNAAAHVLSKELVMRTRRIASAKADAFRFDASGGVFWRDQQIARLSAGDTPLAPRVSVLADEHLSGPDKEKIQARLDTWIRDLVDERAKPLVMMAGASDTSGMARGVAFQLVEAFGILKRADVSDDVRSMDQTSRGQLRRFGVRFGAFNIYFPVLLKPAATELLVLLWRLNAAKGGENSDVLPTYEAPRAGLTSAAADPDVPEAFYRVAGYHICGPRIVRVDMLERLADMIRPLVAWRKKPDAAGNEATAEGKTESEKAGQDAAPAGATGDGGFTVQADMMSILGCSADEVGAILRSLGFRLDRRQLKAEKKEPEPVAVETAANDAASASTPGDAPQPAASAATDAQDAGESDSVPSDDTAANAATAAEEGPTFIDIWRPARHDNHRNRNRARQSQANRRRGGQQGGQNATTDGAADGASANATKPHRGAQQRKTGGEGGRGRDHAKRGHRQDNRRGDKRRNDVKAPAKFSASPPAKKKRDQAADPDSPFAALSKLKAQLETGSETASSDGANDQAT